MLCKVGEEAPEGNSGDEASEEGGEDAIDESDPITEVGNDEEESADGGDGCAGGDGREAARLEDEGLNPTDSATGGCDQSYRMARLQRHMLLNRVSMHHPEGPPDGHCRSHSIDTQAEGDLAQGHSSDLDGATAAR